MDKDITDSWNENTLEVEDIMPIVTRLAEEEKIDLSSPIVYVKEIGLTDSEDVVKKTHEEGLEHVAKLIHRVYRWSQEIHPDQMGSFLTAVVGNKLDEAVGRADSVNVRALPIYVKYFYNYAPRRWRTQKTYREGDHMMVTCKAVLHRSDIEDFKGELNAWLMGHRMGLSSIEIH